MHARLQATVAPVVPQGAVRTPGRLAQSFRGPITTARPTSVPSTHQRGLPEAYRFTIPLGQLRGYSVYSCASSSQEASCNHDVHVVQNCSLHSRKLLNVLKYAPE